MFTVTVSVFAGEDFILRDLATNSSLPAAASVKRFDETVPLPDLAASLRQPGLFSSTSVVLIINSESLVREKLDLIGASSSVQVCLVAGSLPSSLRAATKRHSWDCKTFPTPTTATVAAKRAVALSCELYPTLSTHVASRIGSLCGSDVFTCSSALAAAAVLGGGLTDEHVDILCSPALTSSGSLFRTGFPAALAVLDGTISAQAYVAVGASRNPAMVRWLRASRTTLSPDVAAVYAALNA